jgi:L-iditol 2-dehydrogenase
MLACLLEGPHKIAVKDVPVPTLTSGDVLVRMEASGVCGTDLEKIAGQLGPGGILGHEVSGTIEKVADDIQDYAIGERVIAHHHVPCYKCYLCKRGDLTLCDEFKKTNIDPCGFAEYFRVPKSNVEKGALIKLPTTMSFEEGALIEPTACCIRAIRTANPDRDDTVLVVGMGPTGLTQVQLLKQWTSGHIIGTDIIDSRLKMARRLGAEETLNPQTENVPEAVRRLTGAGVDLALVATGNEKALEQAFSAVRKGGKILLFGAPGQGAHYPLDVSSFFNRQLSLLSSYSCTEAEMHEAVDLVTRKKLDLAALVTDRFQLKKADKALENAKSSKTAVKTIIIR